MKNIKVILLTGIVAAVILAAYILLSNMGAMYGWKPPSTELELNDRESSWRKAVEENYQCKIEFIGLDNGFREDSILYITLEYKDNSKLHGDLNEEIESITQKIAASFIASSKIKRKQSYIQIAYSYIHNYSKDTLGTNIPNWRTCMYRVKDQKILPTVQKLIIPKFRYFDYYTERKDLFYDRLGNGIWSEFKHASQPDLLARDYKIERDVTFKKLEKCESYTSLFPEKIELKGGFIESRHRFVFYENHCVSVLITYNCFPQNSNLTREDFCRKVTEVSPERLKYSKKEKLDLVSLFKKSNYDLDTKMYGVSLKFKTEEWFPPEKINLKKIGAPKEWMITYETSLDDFNYYSTSETE